MSRYYAIQTWVGSHENEPEYSGQQCGNRQAQSHFIGTSANIAAYADVSSDTPAKAPKKLKKPSSVADSIDLASRHYERMEKLSDALEKEWETGVIKEESRYLFLRKRMDERLSKAWLRVEKEQAEFWAMEDKIDAINSPNLYNKNIQSKNSLHCSSFMANVMESLDDSNIFKKAFLIYRYVKQVIQKDH